MKSRRFTHKELDNIFNEPLLNYIVKELVALGAPIELDDGEVAINDELRVRHDPNGITYYWE